MREIRIFFLISLAFSILLMSVFVETCFSINSKIEVKIYAASDAYIDQSNPKQNFGKMNLISVKSAYSRNARILLIFDLSNIPPGASIVRASLHLYLISPPISPRSYLCQHLVSTWAEEEVTWDRKPQSSPIYGSSTKVPTTSGWVVWDITSQVQKFLNGIREYVWDNYGFEIRDENEDSSDIFEASFVSRESPEEAIRPFLVLTFVPPKLELITESQSMIAGSWTKMTLKRVSQDGILVTVGDRIVRKDWVDIGDMSVKLSSSSRTGIFSLTEGGVPLDQLVISNGLTQVEFYYHENTSGIWTLYASTSDYVEGYYEGDSEIIRVIIDDMPPQISSLAIYPESPVMGDLVKVSAAVVDDGSGIKEVRLNYSTDGVNWVEISMNEQAGIYQAYIPSQSVFTEVIFYVRATDRIGNSSKTNIMKFTFGIPLWIYGVSLVVISSIVLGVILLRRRKL